WTSASPTNRRCSRPVWPSSCSARSSPTVSPACISTPTATTPACTAPPPSRAGWACWCRSSTAVAAPGSWTWPRPSRSSAAGRGQGVSLLLVERDRPGISVRQHGELLATVAEVKFEDVRVPQSALLGQVGGGWDVVESALDAALPALCAFQVGACQQIFDI